MPYDITPIFITVLTLGLIWYITELMLNNFQLDWKEVRKIIEDEYYKYRICLNRKMYIPVDILFPIDNFYHHKMVRDFRPGTFVENCNYRPCVITSIDLWGEVELYDIIGNYESSCDFYHCGIKKITLEDVIRKVNLYKKGGERALQIDVGWSPEAADEFNKVWRLPIGMDSSKPAKF